MCSSHRPEAGADSGDWLLRPYRVRVEDEVGDRFWLTVPKALGQHDARHQAIQEAAERGYSGVACLAVEEVVA